MMVFFIKFTVHVLFVLKDALEFVGWELIGVISQAILDDFQSDAFQECKKILKVIAEVSRNKKNCYIVCTCCPGGGGGGGVRV